MITDFLLYAGLVLAFFVYCFVLASLTLAYPLLGVAAFVVSFGIFVAFISSDFFI